MIDWGKTLADIRKVWLEQYAKLRGKFTPAENTLESPNSITKKLQQRNMAMVAGVSIAVIVIGLLFQHRKPVKVATPTSKVVKTAQESPFTSPTENLDGQSVWIERAEINLSNENKKTDNLQKTIQKQTANFNAQVDALNKQQQIIDKLSEQLSAMNDKLIQLEKAPPVQSIAPVYSASGHPDSMNNADNSLDVGMTVTTLALAPMPEAPTPLPDKTPDNYVPSGSYVKAVMLGGLDASAGVNSQGNPRPAFLRTIDNGTLPNNFHSHLKNCRLIGAGYGDLSSERAYIRLESMSCMRDGKIVDFTVNGYVNGNDGKDGVRGKVVMRDGELITKGFIGGALSGFGDSVSDNYTTTSISPLGSTTSVNNGQSLEYGAAQGVSNAADLYAQYNIKRAEQLQPVIEVSAGSEVDIVFTKGFYLDGLTDKERLEQAKPINNNLTLSNRFAVSTSNVSQAGMNPNFNNPALLNQIQQVSRQLPSAPVSDGASDNTQNNTNQLQGFPE
ncbi:MAG: hypothetical protein HKM04_06140 [Legionellales bacterium]|nr:hypothetical protein [Legionellales bacterium]